MKGDAVKRITTALEARGALRQGSNWRCPTHPDRTPSLTVRQGDEEAIVKCRATCLTETVVAELGYTMADLFDEPRTNGHRKIVETYPYVDEHGVNLFEVVRFDPKDFRQHTPDGNWSLKGVRRVLYRLPKVFEQARAGGTVYVVEGERDVHALERAGAVATTNPMGAGKWRPKYAEALTGAHVIVVADCDEPGRKHAEHVAGSLTGTAASVRVVEAAAGKDAADHLRAGHGLDAFRPVEPAAITTATGRRVVLTTAGAIRSERVHWMWRDRVPLRGLTVLAGEKGLGKSICTNAMIPSDLTRGNLDGELENHPVDVLVASAEDDWRAVVKPRLMAHGADLERVHRVSIEDENGDGIITLPDDVARLEHAVTGLREAGRPVGLLVVDPIGSFLAQSTDSHKDAHVRRALAPLAAMADRLDLAVVVVAHLTKDDSRRLISRVNGSGAFVNAARSVLGFVRDPDDPQGEQGNERVLVHASSNWGKYAPSLAARVESRDVVVDDGSTADVGYLKVLGETTISVEDVQRGADDDHESVEAAIIVELDAGERPSLDVKEAVAKRLGCSLKTVERHAVKMRDRDQLVIEKAGWPPTSTWTLTLGTTPDTRIVPNGVPNAKPPINPEDPEPAFHVRDTPRVSSLTVPNVPNGRDEIEPFGGCVDHVGHRDRWRPDPLLPSAISCAVCVPFVTDLMGSTRENDNA